MKTILCVEDETKILYTNERMLTADGYRVLTAENLAQAREILAASSPQCGGIAGGGSPPPDAIVLDIMLPDGNGLDYLQELRAAGCTTPIIMLTAWNRSNNVARGLDLGANDYIGKPFEYEVLFSRIKALFRNIEQIPEFIVKNNITLRVRSMEFSIGNDRIKLPPVEFFMLQLLIENEGKTLSAEHLYEKVWGADMNDDPNAVKIAVTRLRKKLAGSEYGITTVYGEGYRFERG